LVARERMKMKDEAPGMAEGARYIAGGFFSLTGGHADMLLQSLPPFALKLQQGGPWDDPL
jgi:hypothetical protein